MAFGKKLHEAKQAQKPQTSQAPPQSEKAQGASEKTADAVGLAAAASLFGLLLKSSAGKGDQASWLTPASVAVAGSALASSALGLFLRDRILQRQSGAHHSHTTQREKANTVSSSCSLVLVTHISLPLSLGHTRTPVEVTESGIDQDDCQSRTRARLALANTRTHSHTHTRTPLQRTQLFGCTTEHSSKSALSGMLDKQAL